MFPSDREDILTAQDGDNEQLSLSNLQYWCYVRIQPGKRKQKEERRGWKTRSMREDGK